MRGALIFLLCYIPYFAFCKSFKDTLKYYEVLHVNHIQHRVTKRDLSSEGHNRKLNFGFAGKNYTVDLVQKSDILADGFKATSIDGDGNEHVIEIDKLEYYKGSVKEDEDSQVIAHIQNNMITAEIISNKDTIYIEPLEPHQKDKKDHMLIYRVSDVIWNLTDSNSSVRMHEKNCGVPPEFSSKSEEPLDNSHYFAEHYGPDASTRKRRNLAISKNVCHLNLVADYTYYRGIGQSDKVTTTHSLIQVISRVHEIYRKTDFTGIGKNIGFKVANVLVHTGYSTDFKHRYNRKSTNGPWSVDQLLTSFSRTNWKSYCLAHLFTYQDFDNGIIGLAYVASSSIYEVGGICTRSYRDVGGERFLNCGLSSSINWGRRLLTAEADLVTAHEIGHNFGSNHDPSNCQSSGPSGNYIMYAHSVSGEKENNNRFSSCSRYSIGQVLLKKRHMCFVEQKENAFCGNMIVEEGEDCDSGLFRDTDLKQCCTDKCKFRTNPNTNMPYVCSDYHDTCCTNCMPADASKVCRKAIPFYCTGETKCDGTSSKCPASSKLDGNEPCGFSAGNCMKGNCTSLCKQRGKLSCSCASGSSSCKICCRDTVSSPCVVLAGDFKESDGVACYLPNEKGICIDGQCQKNQRNVEDEFKSLLDDFTFSKFLRFMRANIVGTILVLSLFFWIPASCAVHYIDKKQNEKEDFMKVWKNPKSKDLLAKITPGKWKMSFRRSKANKPVRTQYHISS